VTQNVANRWIVKPGPVPDARLRLFAVPFAGGNASVFQQWPPLLSDDVELCAVQFPGRQQRASEAPFKRMPLAVQALEGALAPLLDLPFVIFGNCTGSLAAFELARRLRSRSAVEPLALIVSCCRAPQMPDRDTPIHPLSDDELLKELNRLGGTPPAIIDHPELRALMLPTLRADFELAETYAYREDEPLRCPLFVYGGKQDSIVAPEELDGWREQTTGRFSVEMLDGGHYLIETARAEMLTRIAAALDDVMAEEAKGIAQ
jgi:medium-chain acyl-[acyl-carrier-protein] hydrolase